MQDKGPAGPSGPLQQVYNQLPFVTQPFISLTRNTKMGRGMVVPIASANPNATFVITHNLGRYVQGALGIANGGGGWPPRVAIEAGTRSQRQQSIQVDVACTNALIWVF